MKKIIFCIIVALILLGSKSLSYAGNAYMYPVVANNTPYTIQGFYIHWWAMTSGNSITSTGGDELAPFGIVTAGNFYKPKGETDDDKDYHQYVGGQVNGSHTSVTIEVLIDNKCYFTHAGDTSGWDGAATGLHSWPDGNSTGAFVFFNDDSHVVSHHDYVMLIQVNGMSKDDDNYIGISESDGDCGDIPPKSTK